MSITASPSIRTTGIDPGLTFLRHGLTHAVLREIRRYMPSLDAGEVAWIVEAALWHLRRIAERDGGAALDYLGDVRPLPHIVIDDHPALIWLPRDEGGQSDELVPASATADHAATTADHAATTADHAATIPLSSAKRYSERELVGATVVAERGELRLKLASADRPEASS